MQHCRKGEWQFVAGRSSNNYAAGDIHDTQGRRTVDDHSAGRRSADFDFSSYDADQRADTGFCSQDTGGSACSRFVWQLDDDNSDRVYGQAVRQFADSVILGKHGAEHAEPVDSIDIDPGISAAESAVLAILFAGSGQIIRVFHIIADLRQT